MLDLDSGRWLAESALEQADDDLPSRTDAQRVDRVIPYVRDRRNCLIVDTEDDLEPGELVSLMAALKHGIQAVFELEDGELAAELLPTEDDARSMLFYEASEGGAGALRRLMSEPGSLAQVARMALDICHFDPDTGDDVPTDRVPQPCEAACYDCLMSYRNQRHHELLDRQLAHPLLLRLRDADVEREEGPTPRAAELERLRRHCDSQLERDYLDLLDREDLHLPSHAQKTIDACGCRPDFLYGRDYVAIWIDGPHHDRADQREQDATIDRCLEDLGYTSLRFRYDDKDRWLEQMAAHPSVFGSTQ